ncbi:ARD/ARD' family protein [Onchocerca flexuosa]|uniref:ARD/ARD' family protein n=1 Tax=Onchocerca flexuosa TaxID=387005 RepID=A0A238BS91_9BILA|nr:ARD/ARD' family protein [Onchocerca flexuosa]
MHISLYFLHDKRKITHRSWILDYRIRIFCIFYGKMNCFIHWKNVTLIFSKVDIDDRNAMKKRISRIKAERKMSASDVLTLHENMNNFERKLEQFYEPVAKNVDSIFFIMDGSAYYDIEVDEDEWIRINVERGDLIIIPRGRNYRFTLTTQNKVVVERFFDADTQQG